MSRWKDDEDRGEFGAWLTSKVGDKTFDWLAAEMARNGHVHGADYYRAMASGNKPPGRVIGRALREYFGEPSKEARARPGSTETTDTLVEAIRAQTEAISELAAALRELLSIPVRPDTAEVSEARRILAEAALSGLAEGERRADEGPESRAPSPGRLPRGTEARSA